MTRLRFFIMLITGFISGCEQPTDWVIQAGDRFPVVDCIITNEFRQHEAWLYFSAKGLNETPQGITGARIMLTDGINRISFSDDPLAPGRYLSDTPFVASAGVNYTLAIDVAGFRDSAQASMASIAPLKESQIQPYDSLFRFVYGGSDLPAMTEVYYNWSARPGFCTFAGSCEALEIFYTLQVIDPGREFAPEREIIAFPRQSVLVIRKYSLNEEHQHFIRSLLIETAWRGGLFDIEPGNVPTNFTRGTRGWFAACMVLSDTIIHN